MVREYIGARYVTKIYENSQDPSSAEWEPGINWEPLIIVTYNNGSYMSKKFIPASVGDPASNPDYWTQTGFYNGQIAQLMNDVADINNRIGDFVVASSYDGLDDASKLQAAIDDAIANKYSTVVIDKEFDLDNSTLYISKGLYDTSAERIRYRQKLTFIAVNNGKIKKSGSGFFFSASSYSGDITFINVPFEGNVVLDNMNDVANREAGNSVFDTSKLIRINTINCSFCLVKAVFDGTNSVDTSSNAQQIYNFGDLCTYSACYYDLRYAWDIHSVGCTIENCNDAYRKINSGVDANINMLVIDNCCIEGNTESAINFSDDVNNAVVKNLSVLNSYFENNSTNTGLKHIMLDCDIEGVQIRGNRFSITSDSESAIYIKQKAAGTEISNNLMSGQAHSNVFLINGSIDAAASFPFIIANGNRAGLYVECISALTDNVLSSNANNLKLYPTAASAGLTNANSLLTDAIIHIDSGETVTNLPSGAPIPGNLITFTGSSMAFQTYVTNNSGIWSRSKIPGTAWSLWYQLN